MLAASIFQMKADNPAPASVLEEDPWEIPLSCGRTVLGKGPGAFQFPWEYDEYRMALNYAYCGQMIVPEVYPRPCPTTEPDPGVLGSNKKKGEEQK